MSKGYIAANGQEITEEMIARWCEAYERGEFPEGERSSGQAVLGRHARAFARHRQMAPIWTSTPPGLAPCAPGYHLSP